MGRDKWSTKHINSLEIYYNMCLNVTKDVSKVVHVFENIYRYKYNI